MISTQRWLASFLAVVCSLAAQAGTNDGLVLHLPFDGSFAMAAGTNAAQPVNGPKFTDGKSGQAVALMDKAHLLIPLPASIGPSNDWTITFWARPHWFVADNVNHPFLEIPARPAAYDKAGWADDNLFISKGWSETIAPNSVYGMGDYAPTALMLKPGEWTHFVVGRSQTGRVFVAYVNGVGQKIPLTADAQPPAFYGNTMYLGSAVSGAGGADMDVDDLRVYARLVSQDEVPAIAGTTFPKLPEDWKDGTQCDPARAVETPHVVWAKPLAGGPVRTLFVVDGLAARETIELCQRIDIAPMVIVGPEVNRDRATTVLANREWFENLGRDIESALQTNKPDCVVIASYGWNVIPAKARAAMLDYVKQGGGLVLADPGCLAAKPGPGINRQQNILFYGWDDTPEAAELNKLTGELTRADLDYLTRTIPWQSIPMRQRISSPASLFQGGEVGKGRLLLLRIDTGIQMSEKNSLSPMLPYGTMFDPFIYDYALSPAARSVLWAARRDGALRIQDICPSRLYNRIDWAITLRNTGATAVTARVAFAARTAGPEPAFDKTQELTLPPGLTRVVIAQPNAVGTQFGDVRLTKEGRVEDWGSAVGDISRQPFWVLLSINLSADKSVYEAGQVPHLRAEILFGATQTQIVWRLLDYAGRCVRQGKAKVTSPDRAAVETPAVAEWDLPPLDDASLVYDLVVEAGDGSARSSIQLLRKETTRDDFYFLSWQGGGENYCDSLATLILRDDYGLASGGVYGWGIAPVVQQSVLNWLVRNNLRPWCYPTHIGGGLDAKGQRGTDLADPQWLKGLRQYMTASAGIAGPYSPLYYSLGDETALGDPLSQPTGHEQEAFRAWLKEKYGNRLEALNEAWGITNKSWDAICIPSRAELQAGKTVPELVPFREWLYAHAMGVGLAGARAADADARVGVEGMGGLTQANTGQDYGLIAGACNFMGLYPLGMELNMCRSLQKPGDLLMAWYNYAKLDRNYSLSGPWAALLDGAGIFGWYTTFEGNWYSALNPDFTPFTQFQWTSEELLPLTHGAIGKLLVGLPRESSGVAILHNQRNLERQSPGFHSLVNYVRLLNDLGVPHDFIHGDKVQAGELERRGVKVLLLIGQGNMAKPVADAIRAYAVAGGTVVADTMPAWANGMRGYDKPLLEDMFVKVPSLKTQWPPRNAEDVGGWHERVLAVGKGKSVMLGQFPPPDTSYTRQRFKPSGALYRQEFASVLAENGVKPSVRVQAADGSFLPARLVIWKDEGGALYAGVQRDYAVPDQAPRDMRLQIGAKAHVYDVKAGKYLGESDQATLSMDPARGYLAAFLPYKVEAVCLDGLPAQNRQGDRLAAHAKLNVAGGKPSCGVFRIEVRDPKGRRIEPLCRRLRWKSGEAAFELPIAWNDPVGKWNVRVTDVATGVSAEQALNVSSGVFDQ